jgi:hypothetical protein
MPLDRVPGKQSDVLVDHADGLGRASIFGALAPSCGKD